MPRRQWMAITALRNLSPIDRDVLFCLYSTPYEPIKDPYVARRKMRTKGFSYKLPKTIARHLDVHKDTVKHSIAKLTRQGYLQREEEGTGLRLANKCWTEAKAWVEKNAPRKGKKSDPAITEIAHPEGKKSDHTITPSRKKSDHTITEIAHTVIPFEIPKKIHKEGRVEALQASSEHSGTSVPSCLEGDIASKGVEEPDRSVDDNGVIKEDTVSPTQVCLDEENTSPDAPLEDNTATYQFTVNPAVPLNGSGIKATTHLPGEK